MVTGTEFLAAAEVVFGSLIKPYKNNFRAGFDSYELNAADILALVSRLRLVTDEELARLRFVATYDGIAITLDLEPGDPV